MTKPTDKSPADARSGDELAFLARIAAALERLAPAPPPAPDLAAAEAFVWHAAPGVLAPVAKVNRVDI